MVNSDYVLSYIKTNPGCSTAQIVDSLGGSKYERSNIRTNIYAKCRKLELYGLVSHEQMDGHNHWTATGPTVSILETVEKVIT